MIELIYETCIVLFFGFIGRIPNKEWFKANRN